MIKLFDNKVFKFMFKTIETILVLVLALYVGVLILQRYCGDGSFYGYHVYTVATGSMVPVYEVNDVIVVKGCKLKDLKVGDDIAYEGTRGGMEGKTVTHRIIKIDKDDNGDDRIFTQGVANKEADPSISFSQVVGKVEGKIFFISDLNHIINNQFGFFFLVFCPLVLVITLEVMEVIADIKKDKLALVEDVNEEENDDKNKDNKENNDIIEDSLEDEEILDEKIDESIDGDTTKNDEVVADEEVI